MQARPSLGRHVSPDSAWEIEIAAPTGDAPAFYASVTRGGAPYMGFPFGYAAPPDSLTVRWDLPDDCCGMYLEGRCYAVFRWGGKRRRNRELHHTGRNRHLSDEEIARFCSRRRPPQKRRT